MTLRRVGLAIALGTLVVSGYYVLAYLYWWEWNRALIAGVFFLAIEAAIGVLLVLGRLDRLERRIESEGRLGSHHRTVDVLHANCATTTRPFRVARSQTVEPDERVRADPARRGCVALGRGMADRTCGADVRGADARARTGDATRRARNTRRVDSSGLPTTRSFRNRHDDETCCSSPSRSERQPFSWWSGSTSCRT